MRVSFDFDGTLRRIDVQEYAKSLVQEGHEVWIVTSRYSAEAGMEKGWPWIEQQNLGLFSIAEECGILKERIVFTNGAAKINWIKSQGFAFHLDDDVDELMKISEGQDPCRPVNVDHFEWKKSCNKIIEDGRLHT